MSILHNYFDKIYCINLDRRTDRWEKSKEQFDKLGIIVERFSAIEPASGNSKLSKGEVGISLSNIELIKRAKENNYKNILIFEDDLEFIVNFNVLFDSFIKQVPDNWDMIYFGGNHVGGISQINTNIFKMFHSYAIHSVVIKNTMFDLILERAPKAEKQIDVYYAEFHRTHNCYCFRPHLTWQRPDYSDIANSQVDYDFLRR